MNDSARTKVVEDSIAMFSSLNNAVIFSGGTFITYERLTGMSAIDLFSHLATNGIRFIHTKNAV